MDDTDEIIKKSVSIESEDLTENVLETEEETAEEKEEESADETDVQGVIDEDPAPANESPEISSNPSSIVKKLEAFKISNQKKRFKFRL